MSPTDSVVILRDNSNYKEWKLVTIATAMSQGVPCKFLGAEAEVDEKHDEVLYAVIVKSLRGRALETIKKVRLGAGRQALEELDRVFDRQTTQTKFAAYRKLFSLKCESAEKLEDYLATIYELEDLIRQSWDMKDLFPAAILAGVSHLEDFRCTTAVFNSLDEKSATMEVLVANLREAVEMVAMSGGEPASKKTLAVGVSPEEDHPFYRRKLRKCKKCGKMGKHRESECNAKLETLQLMVKKANPAEVSDPLPDSALFIVDSGASCHCCNNKDVFAEMWSEENFLTLADGQTIRSLWMGNISGNISGGVGEESVPVMINNVVYCPELRYNLLSVAAIVSIAGTSIKFGESFGEIVGAASKVLFPKRGNQYEIVLTPRKTSTIAPVDHALGGHLPHDPKCETCIKARNRRKRIPKVKASKDKAELWERVHLDLCAITPVSARGHKYVAIAVEHVSRYLMAVPLKQKSQAKLILKEIRKRNFGQHTTIKPDGAPELLAIEEPGFRIIASPPYTPQLNGTSESGVQLFKEGLRATLLGNLQEKNGEIAEVAKLCWNLAVQHVCDSKNQVKHSRTGYTPNEMINWIRDEPIAAFGEIVFYKPDHPVDSLESRARYAMYLGLSSKSFSCYRLLGESGKVFESRNVKRMGSQEKKGPIKRRLLMAYIKRQQKHEKKGEELKSVNYPRPRGAAPKNKKWDYLCGGWKSIDSPDTQVVDPPDAQDEVLPSDTDDQFDDESDEETKTLESKSSIDQDELDESSCPEEDQSFTRKGEEHEELETSSVDMSSEADGGIAMEVENENQHHKLVGKRKLILESDDETDKRQCVRIIRNKTKEALKNDKELWLEAIKKEYFSILRHQSVEEIKYYSPEKKVVPTMLILETKSSNRRKARIVALGNQCPPDEKKTSTVISGASLKTLLALTLDYMEKPILSYTDIPTAFLKGDVSNIPPTEEVILIPPKELVQLKLIHPKTKWLSRGNLYGLSNAPRIWQETMHNFLIDLGLEDGVIETNIFRDKNGFLALYVDDVLGISENEKSENTLEEINRKFGGETVKSDCFKYIDYEIEQGQNCLTLNQEQYIKKILKREGLSDCNKRRGLPENSLLKKKSESENVIDEKDFQYSAIVGELNYIALKTRPDLAYTMIKLSENMSAPTERHVNAVKQTLRYLQGTKHLKLHYEKVGNQKQIHLEVYTDSNFDTPNSTSGVVIFVNQKLVHWISRRQRGPTLSTMESELVAACLGLREGESMMNTIEELYPDHEIVKTLKIDQQSALGVLKESTTCRSVRHIEVAKAYVLHHLKSSWKFERIETGLNRADICTKVLPPKKLEHARKEFLGIF